MSEIVSVKLKTTLSGWLLWLLVMLPFFFGTLNDLLGAPWGIRYVLDVAWFALFGLMIRRRGYTGNWKVGSLAIWVMLFLLYTLVGYILQYQSGLYYLWGLRNDFRFYVAFFAFASFLTIKDAEDFLKIFDFLFWINVIISLVQFFIFELDGDHLGGLFGTEKGGNAYTNIFFLIVVARSVIFYLERRESAGSCLCKCAAALVIAALAELKFFFVEFMLVIMLAVLFTSFTWRKFWILLGSVVGVLICAALLTKLFPGFAGWFSVRWFLEAALSTKGYTSSGDLNRLNAISQINELWLQDGAQQLFGLGLGNCETSSVAFLNTPFYEANADMHYTWFSYAMMYLETGWIGLVFYWGFFILVYFRIRRMEGGADAVTGPYCKLAKIMVILCVAISVYNSSLRTEAGYMAYFVMAIPFAMAKNKKHNRRVEIISYCKS